MAYEHRPKTGTLFQNDRKQKASQPDWRGDVCLEDGTILSLAGWAKDTSTGRKMISLKVEHPDQREAASRQPEAERVELRKDVPMDDEIPF